MAIEEIKRELFINTLVKKISNNTLINLNGENSKENLKIKI